MKVKGFTLVELMLIIILLGIIALITTPVIRTVIKQVQERQYNVIIKQVEEAADGWTYKNTESIPQTEDQSITITFGELKRSGLLQPNVTNPKTNKKFSDSSYVIITRKFNSYTYDVVTIDEN